MTVWTAPSIASLKGDNTLPLQKIFKSLTEELQRRSVILVDSLGLKANIASPTFTGTVGGITKAMVGLGSVDNTADTAKPVSTAQQTALNLKANLVGADFSGAITATQISTSSPTTKDQMRLEPSNTGTIGSFITLRPATLTSSRAVTFQDASGTVALTSDVNAVTTATRALIGSGSVSITPVASTMTSGNISWGTTMSGTPKVGTSAISTSATVTHTAHTSPSTTGVTVWILRSTTTATTVDAVGIVS